MCTHPAGKGTGHFGYGQCEVHGGLWPQNEDAWRQAMELAKIEGIGPTEALLKLVTASMGRAAYMDLVLEAALARHVADGGDPLIPPASMRPWLKESRQERMVAGRMAKAAVDAGVMEALGRRLDMEGGLVADALTAALDALELEPAQRMKALGAAQERLLSAE
jgi:hypothetical protein